MPKKTVQEERYSPEHRWVSLVIRFDAPGETELVEWCAQCGKLKLKRWESKGRARQAERPQYYVPNADFPRDSASSHNHWGEALPPECKPVPLHAR